VGCEVFEDRVHDGGGDGGGDGHVASVVAGFGLVGWDIR
jgi:hypothetical protein